MKKFIALILCIFTVMTVFSVSAYAYSVTDPLVIVLDPGHGGMDSGAVYPQGSKTPIACEREINLKIAKTIQSELSVYSNVKVLLTREDNESSLTLTERGYFAGKNKANVLISVHSNSSPQATTRGAEVISPIESTWCSEAYEIGAELGKGILKELEALGLKNRGVYTRTTTKPDTEKYKDGSVMDYYTVINAARECMVPAIIVEHGFICNKDDYEEFLSTDEKLEAIGKADARAIINYYGITECDWIFSDVPDNGSWISTAAGYVKQKGYFSGYENGSFGVTDTMKRQDFVLVLSRATGVDLTEYEKPSDFADVPENEYYTAAVNWAKENKVISGYENGKFGVNDPITREQLVTVLHSYAKNYLNIDVTPSSTKATAYPDFNTVTDYAKESIIWAVDKGVISGLNGEYISPHTNAQRIQVAQILKSMDDNGILKNDNAVVPEQNIE